MTAANSRRPRQPGAARITPKRRHLRDDVALFMGAVVHLTICLGLPSGSMERFILSDGLAATMETAPAAERSADSVTRSSTASEQPRDPLAEVLQWMEESEKRLNSGDTGPGTRQLQQNVVKRLEELIRQAEGASASASASARQSQTPPMPSSEEADDSATAARPGENQPGRGETQGGGENSAEDLRMVLQRIWGELPQRERDILMQRGAESFLPKYRPMIEAYFRRLSEGRAASGKDRIMTVPRATMTLPKTEGRQ